jgi:hypothetical protein
MLVREASLLTCLSFLITLDADYIIIFWTLISQIDAVVILDADSTEKSKDNYLDADSAD